MKSCIDSPEPTHIKNISMAPIFYLFSFESDISTYQMTKNKYRREAEPFSFTIIIFLCLLCRFPAKKRTTKKPFDSDKMNEKFHSSIPKLNLSRPPPPPSRFYFPSSLLVLQESILRFSIPFYDIHRDVSKRFPL